MGAIKAWHRKATGRVMGHALESLYACKLTLCPASLYPHHPLTENFPKKATLLGIKIREATALPSYGGKSAWASRLTLA